MKYTTHFGLQSQTTRLLESVSHRDSDRIMDGILTLYDAPFQGTYTRAANENASTNYNSPKGF
jgi:hypothetical protein